MTSEVKPAFDYQKYVVKAETEVKIVTIEETGEEFEVKIRNLSWSKKNQLVSKHVKWTSEGISSFDTEGYMRDVLKEIIVEAPWGKTSETFLVSIDSRLGSALEKIVPIAFEGSSIPEDKKKESNGT
jgi:hypothetical protein